MTTSLDEWDKKIHRLNNKIHEFDIVADNLEKQGKVNVQTINDLVSRIQSQFLIDGIIGSAEDDLYPSISRCISDLSTFKHSAEKSFGKLCDQKIEHRLRDVFQKIDDETEETMELMRVQEQQLSKYRDHMEMIEDTIEDLKKGGGLRTKESKSSKKMSARSKSHKSAHS